MTTNLNPDERDKFSALAAHWWDAHGPCRTLHDINPCRYDYVAAQVSLQRARVADIGCGGGIFSEALARVGAHVTAIDASSELIEVARHHALTQGLPVHYEALTAEQLAHDKGAHFDVVTCLELIEHVPDAQSLIAACAQLLKPGGVLVMSTLNRNATSYALGVVMAEYVLRLVPRGTHDYMQFIRPSELAAMARAAGLDTRDIRGMDYTPWTHHARLTAHPTINYLATFARPAA